MLNAGGGDSRREGRSLDSAHATSHLRCAAASAILVLLDRRFVVASCVAEGRLNNIVNNIKYGCMPRVVQLPAEQLHPGPPWPACQNQVDLLRGFALHVLL